MKIQHIHIFFFSFDLKNTNERVENFNMYL